MFNCFSTYSSPDCSFGQGRLSIRSLDWHTIRESNATCRVRPCSVRLQCSLLASTLVHDILLSNVALTQYSSQRMRACDSASDQSIGFGAGFCFARPACGSLVPGSLGLHVLLLCHPGRHDGDQEKNAEAQDQRSETCPFQIMVPVFDPGPPGPGGAPRGPRDRKRRFGGEREVSSLLQEGLKACRTVCVLLARPRSMLCALFAHNRAPWRARACLSLSLQENLQERSVTVDSGSAKGGPSKGAKTGSLNWLI